ncbi:lymphocyte function-associated antigen 3 isoform X2 [Choloepus didactylus]|uniref:lymphocyte function-associated antigen 3 isoform X2 n=1 Tax=Choloepus didactylus TaxID=27675 RepID=UPI00189ED319|nr:lymphocyte function-associated antigen 3 isoform X2 [Choloepus didactylus]
MAAGSAPGRILEAFSVVCLLLRFGFISCDSRTLFGTVNKNITFRLPSHSAFTEIMWKKQKDKVVEWDENSEVTYFPPFQDRIHLDTVSGDLTIFNLISSDEGRYEVESQSIKDNITFSLRVVEPLPSLELNCTLIGENIVVQCWLQKPINSHPELIEYSWECPSVQCKNNSEREMYFRKEDDLSQEIQCIVNNKVSEKKSSIALATCNSAVPYLSRVHVLLPAFIAVTIICVIIVLYMRGLLRCGRRTGRATSVEDNGR